MTDYRIKSSGGGRYAIFTDFHYVPEIDKTRIYLRINAGFRGVIRQQQAFFLS